MKILKYCGLTIDYEFIEEREGYFCCRLIFDKKTLRLYRKLSNKKDDECWYLDDEGYRLDSEELFKASPWVLEDDDKSEKLLCRFQDINNECTFQKKEYYTDWAKFLVNKDI